MDAIRKQMQSLKSEIEELTEKKVLIKGIVNLKFSISGQMMTRERLNTSMLNLTNVIDMLPKRYQTLKELLKLH